MQPFHLALSVRDLNEARSFYRDLLGFKEGRSSDKWVDFDMYGHQFVIHEDQRKGNVTSGNFVDGHNIPVPHFGVVLTWDDWIELSENLKSKIDFIVEPYIRFKGEVGEQATMFFKDPSGNALEFKAFQDISQLFAK